MTLLPFSKQLDALYKRDVPTHTSTVDIIVAETSPSPDADPWDALASLSALQQLQLCSGSSVLLGRDPQQDRARLVPLRLAPPTPPSSGSGSSSALSISPLLAFNLGLPLAINALLASPQEQAAAPSTQLKISPAAAAPATAAVDHGLGAAPQQAAGPACASFVRFAKVGVPHISTLGPAAGGEAGGGGPEEVAAGQWGEEEAGVLQAVQAFFRSRRRHMMLGDVFAVSVPSASAMAAAGPFSSPADSSGPCGESSATLYFRVVDLQPEAPACLLIDPLTTQVALQGGHCRCPRPVGHEGWAARGGSSSTSASPTDSLNAGSEQPAGAAALQQQQAAPAPPLLGVHVSAASHPQPGLPGLRGPLLPTWRALARLAAPLLHPASLATPVKLSLLLHGPRGSGKQVAVRAAAAALGVNVIPWSAYDLKGSSEAKTAAKLNAVFAEASRFAPCLLLLRHLDVLVSTRGAADPNTAVGTLKLAAALQANIDRYCSSEARRCVLDPRAAGASVVGAGEAAPGLVLVLGSVSSRDNLAVPLGRCFTHDVPVATPERASYQAMVEQLLGPALAPGQQAQVAEQLPAQLAGLLPGDVCGVVADAVAGAAAEALAEEERRGGAGSSSSSGDAAGPGSDPPAAIQVDGQHVEQALARVKARTATEIGAPQVPNVKWDDIGGLEDVKRAILDTIELPLRHRELFAGGLRRRSGVLLYGPPGSGKTLLAKAVATQCSCHFMSVKGPELINMYVGESERQVREAFARARRARPCVMFFDELDSLAPARGAAGDSGGVMDRVVAQLLVEVDGVQGGGEELFIIGATNRPDLLDPALMRPGRLDTLLYVGIAEEPAAKIKVLQALTRKFQLAPDVDLAALAQACPPTLTGADLYALCADAWMVALKRRISQAEAAGQDLSVVREAGQEEEGEGEEGGSGGAERPQVVVSGGDLRQALYSLTPSLGPAELEQYRQLKEHYEARGK